MDGKLPDRTTTRKRLDPGQLIHVCAQLQRCANKAHVKLITASTRAQERRAFATLVRAKEAQFEIAGML